MYDAITASHYSAYRPPFHSIILARALRENKKRQLGIDIGCGTGRSAQALARFCNLVVGIEPSSSMLDKTEKHEKIHYVNSPGENVPITDKSVDIVTMAGSLNYIERDSLVIELERICRVNAEVVVYDFEIDLTNFDSVLGVELADFSPGYDHSANLSEYSIFFEVISVKEDCSTNANPLEIVHLLLSDPGRYNALCNKHKIQNPLNMVENEIGSMFKKVTINSYLFYSVYTLQPH